MMQAVENPHGITAFGSFLIRAEPDRAVLSFRITRTRHDAREAFAETRKAASAVRALLDGPDEARMDLRMSAITLATAFDGYGASQKVIGQRASMAFTVVLEDLGAIEAIIADVVDQGVDIVDGVTLHTSRLKELRAEARRGAVHAARAKAELYAEAAGVRLGNVLHVEDVDPNRLARGGHAEDLSVSHIEDDASLTAASPGTMTVAAAVTVSYAIV